MRILIRDGLETLVEPFFPLFLCFTGLQNSPFKFDMYTFTGSLATYFNFTTVIKIVFGWKTSCKIESLRGPAHEKVKSSQYFEMNQMNFEIKIL